MVARINKYTILIVILSVLLAISLIVGTTFAWFTSQDSSSRTIVLGDPVILNIVNADNEIIGDNKELPIVIPGNKLLPGMQVNVLARVLFVKSNTPALLRARINITIENTKANLEEIYDLEQQLNTVIHSAVDTSGLRKWVYNQGDGWWYFIGPNAVYYDDVTQSVMHRIDNSGEDVNSRIVTFLEDSFIFPYYVGNNFANSDVKFEVEFQAVQGYIPAYEEPNKMDENEIVNGSPTPYRLNKIKNVIEVFEETFGN